MHLNTFTGLNLTHSTITNPLWNLSQDVNQSVYTNSNCRLMKIPNRNGTVEITLIPKTPAEVVGEKLLRPLINRTVSVLKGGFYLIDTLFSASLNLLPTAAAAVPSNPCENASPDVEAMSIKLEKAEKRASDLEKEVTNLKSQLKKEKEAERKYQTLQEKLHDIQAQIDTKNEAIKQKQAELNALREEGKTIQKTEPIWNSAVGLARTVDTQEYEGWKEKVGALSNKIKELTKEKDQLCKAKTQVFNEMQKMTGAKLPSTSC